MRARFHKLLVGLAVAAAIGAPTAVAQSPDTVTVPKELLYIQGPGGNNDPSLWENFRGGPGGGGPVLSSDNVVGVSGNGFDWIDAAVGAGLVAGLALIVAAALLALRKRRTLAHV